MKTQLTLMIAATLLGLNAFASAEGFKFECKGTSPNVRNQVLNVELRDDQVRLTNKEGMDLNGSQDKAFVPRSRRNYTRFELKAGPTLLVEEALLDGGYSLRDGGRGGYVQTETQTEHAYVTADYLCQQK